VNCHCDSVEPQNVRMMVLFRTVSFRRWTNSFFVHFRIPELFMCMSCNQVCLHTPYICYSCVLWLISQYFHPHQRNYFLLVGGVFMNLSHFICPALWLSSHLLCHPGSVSLSFQISLAFLLIWFDSTTLGYCLSV
jgi:hypothetical protein